MPNTGNRSVVSDPEKHSSGSIKHYRKVRLTAPCERSITCRVRPHETGMEVIRFLSGRFPFRSPETWTSRLRSGWITQGSHTLHPGDPLRPSPALTIYHPRFIEPAVPDEVEILEVRDEYLLAFKPAPMPMHPGGRYNRNTLIEIIKDQPLSSGHYNSQSDSAQTGLHILHRLDAVTSGLVLLGRNPGFSRTVQRAFEQNRVEKHYLALVAGTPVQDRITIDRPIRRKRGYLFECTLKGKASVSTFEVLKRMGKNALVLCRPITGRTHQIRLHLREWGHPVIDDPVYGPVTNKSAPVLTVSEPTGTLPDGYSLPMQNSGISLLHYRLKLPGMGYDFRLFDNPLSNKSFDYLARSSGNPALIESNV